MINPFTRSTFLEICARAICIITGLLFIFWYTVDLWVDRKVPFIESAVSEALHVPVSIGKGHYDLFRGVLFDDVLVMHHSVPVHIHRVGIGAALTMLPTPTMVIRKIVLEGPDIALTMHPDELFGANISPKDLSSKDGRVGLFRIRMDLSLFEILKGKIEFLSPVAGKNQKQTVRDLFLKLRNGKQLEVAGKIAIPEFSSGKRLLGSAWPQVPDVRFSMTGVCKENGPTFSKVLVQCGPIELKGDGEVDISKSGGNYRFSLFSDTIRADKLKDLFPSVVLASGALRFSAKLKGDARSFEPTLDVVFDHCSAYDFANKISLEQMAGRLHLSKRDLEIKDVCLLFNDRPLRINARYRMQGRDRFVLEAFSSPKAMADLRPRHSFKASIKVVSIRLKEGWSGYVRVSTAESRMGRRDENIRTLSYHGLGWGMCRSLRLRQIHWPEGGNAVLFSARKLGFIVSLSQRYLQADVSDASLKTGDTRLKARVYFTGPTYDVSATVRDVEISRVLNYVGRNYPITGRVSAVMFWTGERDRSECKIQFKVLEGSLGPDGRLAYWAQHTGIDALNSMRFHSISGEADYGSGSWKFRNLSLSGDSVFLTANLKLIEKRVSGVLSVRFLASLVHDTGLQWLLHFVNAGEWVDFDFKIAGHLMSPRIQWEGGEFKKKIESRFAPWMKNELDRQIAKRMSENSAAL